MIKRGKKGQFYLIAAIVIAIIVFGLVSVSNYAKVEKKDMTIYEAGDELKGETSKVVDYALVKNEDVSGMINNWTELYVLANEGEDVENWVFVYGNKTNSTVLVFSKTDSGSITLEGAGGSFQIITRKTKKLETEFSQEEIIFRLNEQEYKFNLTADKEFLFLINKEGYVTNSENPEN